MNQIKHDLVEARLGDDIEIVFSVLDRAGNAVTVAGSTATYRVAQKGSTSHIFEKTETDGITLSGSTATVAFNADELDVSGDFTGQLRITKSGKALVVSEGELKIQPLIE